MIGPANKVKSPSVGMQTGGMMVEEFGNEASAIDARAYSDVRDGKPSTIQGRCKPAASTRPRVQLAGPGPRVRLETPDTTSLSDPRTADQGDLVQGLSGGQAISLTRDTRLPIVRLESLTYIKRSEPLRDS